MVKEIYGVDINYNNIPLDDEKTWNLIGNGNTLGVFQFASHLAVSVVTKVKPRNIEELAAANAFIRPGASGLDDYVNAKININKIHKLHPSLDPILDVTYGSIVYQEQIMGLIAAVMDIDFGEADVYRRWLEKPTKFAEKVAKWKEDFIKIGIEKGFSQKLVDHLVQLIIDNCGYGFNKSHAIAYSIVSYWTAYMKANFPLVFYTTMLNGNLDEADSFMAEARKLEIKILPPHVNSSKFTFTVEKNETIRAGFNSIKGVGPKAVESIIATQPYSNVDDYFARNDKSAVNKGVVGALIDAGAFDGLGLKIEERDIPHELHGKFNLEWIENELFVYFEREQMSKWYGLLNEINSTKASPNHLVPTSLIKGKYFSQLQLIEEKDGDVIVVPQDKLSELDLKLSDLSDQTPTRKKSKGSFDKSLDPMKSVPIFRKPIILHHRELSTIQVTNLERYLKETEEFGFSFLPHPLEHHMDKINIYEEIPEGGVMTTAGIITDIVKRPTKKPGNYMYWVTVKSPRDSVRVTLWSNQMESHKDYVKKHHLIMVRGTKGYGGMGADVIKKVKIKDKE
ncbi:DNA polymerase III subunit alpha [compost metagenome]